MFFSDTPRVKYGLQPLKEVICQLVFATPIEPALYTDELAASIQETLGKDFRLFDVKTNHGVQVNVDNKSTEMVSQKLYEIATMDRNYMVTLSQDFISFTTTQYTCWEDFSKIILTLINENTFLSELGSFARIGLRYRDVLIPSELGLSESVAWGEYVNPKLAALLLDDEFESAILGGLVNYGLQLSNNPNEQLNIQSGMAIDSTTNERCFLIDGDFYSSGDIKHDECSTYLARFNVYARNFFRWAISEELHNMLKPTAVK